MADLVTKYNGSADLHSSLPSINNCFPHQFLLYCNVLFFPLLIYYLGFLFCLRYFASDI